MRVLVLLPLFLFISCSIPAQRRPASMNGNSCFLRVQKSFHQDQEEAVEKLEEITKMVTKDEIHTLLKSSDYQEIFENSQSEIEKEYFASILSLLKKDNPSFSHGKIKKIFFDFFEC